MRRRTLLALPAVVVLSGLAGGAAVAGGDPPLRASEPTAVSGTDGTAVFDIGVHHVRQVRYDDRGTLRYTFRLHNDGALPVTVTGLSDEQPRTRLFRPLGIGDEEGEPVSIGGGDSVEVTLSLLMTGCETLSARAGSLLTEVVLRTERAGGMVDDEVAVRLPEELRTGSPREAFCPGATATSRPRG